MGVNASAVAIAVAIAASANPALPALAEDSRNWASEFSRKADADVADYLKKHPVRPSLLYDSVSMMLATLGKVDAMATDECVSDPAFPDWREVIPRLRENTVVALYASFLNAQKEYRAATPPGETIRDGTLCDEQIRRHAEIEGQLARLGPALRKQGY